MRILHILKVFGHKDQPYTTNMLQNTNKLSTNKHFVFAEIPLLWSPHINVLSSNSPKSLRILFFILKTIFNKNIFKELKMLSFKEKVKFIAKWYPVLNNKFEIVHVHHLHVVDIYILKILKNRGTKIVSSLRGRDLLVNLQDQSLLEIFKEKIYLVNHVHVISFFLNNKFKNLKLPVNSSVVYRGNSGIQERNINKPSNREMLRNLKIIIAGRLEWEKGHIYVLDSVFRLKNKGYNIILDIYGNGKFLEYLHYRINQLGITNEVNLKGYLESEKLRTLYKEYNLAIQPSITEALSNSVLDFSCHNLPVVISNVDGMPEIIEHEKNGIHFNIKEPESLDLAIIKCLDLDIVGLTNKNNQIRDKFTLKNEIYGLDKIYYSL